MADGEWAPLRAGASWRRRFGFQTVQLNVLGWTALLAPGAGVGIAVGLLAGTALEGLVAGATLGAVSSGLIGLLVDRVRDRRSFTNLEVEDPEIVAATLQAAGIAAISAGPLDRLTGTPWSFRVTIVRPTTVEIPTRLLVFGMTQANGTVDAAELYDVAEACGLTPDQVRSCLRRLVDEGLFVRSGEGRDARFQATDHGLSALTSTVERTRLAYAQDAAGRGWDRKWRLVAYAVPEARRASRDSLRDRLVAMGGAPVQGGLYVSPHRWHDDVVAEATRLGVLGSITIAATDDLEIGGERDPRKLAASLWNLDDVAKRYEAFLEQFNDVPDTLTELRKQHRRLPDSAFLPGALVMAVAFQDVFEDDPLLPPELLPRPWPGRAARDLLIRSRRQALAIREAHGRAALFRFFDDMVEAIA